MPRYDRTTAIVHCTEFHVRGQRTFLPANVFVIQQTAYMTTV